MSSGAPVSQFPMPDPFAALRGGRPGIPWQRTGPRRTQQGSFIPGGALQRPGTAIGSPSTVNPAYAGFLEQMNQPRFLEQLASSLFSDIGQQQAAATAQWGRNEAEITGFRDFLGEAGQRLTSEAGAAAGRMNEQAGRVEGAGSKQQQEQEAYVQRLNEEARRRADEAGEVAGRAVDDIQTVIAGYTDDTARIGAQTAFGIRRRMQGMQKQMAAGINPDGTMMTPEQRQVATMQMTEMTENQVNEALLPIRMRAADQLRELGVTKASYRQAHAQTLTAGAGIVAQTGVAGGQLRQASADLNQQALQLGAQYRQFGESLRSSAELSAVQFEAQGRVQLAEMVRQNPFTLVSLFSGMSALFAVATAPGAGGVPGVNPSLLPGG